MRIYLKREFFGDREFLLAENNNMKATAFKYSTGVEAIKVENKKGYFIILPFQGQQIWRACFLGKDLVMRTSFEEPVPTTEYLETYGGFLVHCGVQGMGVPQAGDTHKQHGEVPNVAYQKAYMEIGKDYMTVGGVYEYNKSFVKHYLFNPECSLQEDDTVLKVKVRLENKRHEPLEYMYLCHINFRPIDGAELIYSADYDSSGVKVHKLIGDGVPKEEAEKLMAYMEAVEKDPTLHHKVGAPGQLYDPEICFTIYYKGDENGRAYTLQYNEEGACYVSHPVEQLPIGIRWISRKIDEQSMGMVLPATAEHLGYTDAKSKGQIKVLQGMESVEFNIEAGYLEKERADQVKTKIEQIKNN
ncbi:MAG: DUF4432 family protein [Lachnospiraceae bacterium]|nr:DUF4432 family protein [Lachnospiraceae bacterium]